MAPENRRDPRVSFTAAVRVLPQGLQAFLASPGDLSMGGIFVQTGAEVAVGERVTLSIQTAEGQGLEVEGKVAWRRAQEDPQTGYKAGLGIQFVDLTPESKAALAEMVRRSSGA